MANEPCVHLVEFLRCEMDVMERHLANHKWFNKIPDEADGIADFISKYGWLMRDLYCRYACELRSTCTVLETDATTT